MIGKVLGARWSEMAEEDKAHWQRTAEADKERYERELAEYEAQDDEEEEDSEGEE